MLIAAQINRRAIEMQALETPAELSDTNRVAWKRSTFAEYVEAAITENLHTGAMLQALARQQETAPPGAAPVPPAP